MEQKTENSALLVMDMQTLILRNLPDATSLIKNITRALDHARKNKTPVIYVTVGFRPGAPEISVNNKSFTAARERFVSSDTQEWMKIHPDLIPLKDEIIVIKRRISAFTGSDLEVILKALGILHLVLTGFSTSGVVLSTLREAADKDYRTITTEQWIETSK
jgi:nicotinamidase-related amidase